ncbi:hypothetical protein PYW08_009187 [Mythimna loreyi]|uniref:Uncharacterized protein n=1 Tax=Mythimna loreyi TaxID=667449 RepID=A0ACC2Q8G7_9NEOP|nr:hypothetical protein PYW08_009187 [Mythimna loreyi]
MSQNQKFEGMKHPPIRTGPAWWIMVHSLSYRGGLCLSSGNIKKVVDDELIWMSSLCQRCAQGCFRVRESFRLKATMFFSCLIQYRSQNLFLSHYHFDVPSLDRVQYISGQSNQ